MSAAQTGAAAAFAELLGMPAALAQLAAMVSGMAGELVALRRENSARAESLEPLSRILGCSADAARARCNRDAALAALGLRVGRRLMFRRAEVAHLLAERQRERAGRPSTAN